MISYELANGLILGACGLGFLWAIINAFLLSKVKIGTPDQYNSFQDDYIDQHSQLLLEIGSLIESGANAFLAAEYRFIFVVVIMLSLLIFFVVEPVFGTAWTTVAFIAGAITSILSGNTLNLTVRIHRYESSHLLQLQMCLLCSDQHD